MITPSPVTTLADVESMRWIFNACREFMTKHFDPITPEQQAKWWKNLPTTVRKFKAFIYREEDVIVAYSLLQWHFDGRTTPLFGIAPHARGKNLARQIIQHYLAEAGGPLYGEQLVSHTAIRKLNEEAGWQVLREENGVQYLYHPNEKRTYPDYRGLVEYWSKGE